MKGDWNDELLILNKGSAKTQGSAGDEGFTVFEAGSFWGEMQFLGLERQRTLSVYASNYCEIGSLSPGSIRKLTYGEQITNRLKAYATMRQELEIKLSAGEKPDMQAAMEELEIRYKREEEKAEQVVPPTLAKLSGDSTNDPGQPLSNTIQTALEDMQVAHRQTEGQVALLAQKTEAQLGQLLALVQDLSARVAEVQETADASARPAKTASASTQQQSGEDEKEEETESPN